MCVGDRLSDAIDYIKESLKTDRINGEAMRPIIEACLGEMEATRRTFDAVTMIDPALDFEAESKRIVAGYSRTRDIAFMDLAVEVGRPWEPPLPSGNESPATLAAQEA